MRTSTDSLRLSALGTPHVVKYSHDLTGSLTPKDRPSLGFVPGLPREVRAWGGHGAPARVAAVLCNAFILCGYGCSTARCNPSRSNRARVTIMHPKPAAATRHASSAWLLRCAVPHALPPTTGQPSTCPQQPSAPRPQAGQPRSASRSRGSTRGNDYSYPATPKFSDAGSATESVLMERLQVRAAAGALLAPATLLTLPDWHLPRRGLMRVA